MILLKRPGGQADLPGVHSPGSLPLPPPDLPRSRTGRTPRWVLDEVAGRAPVDDLPWRAAPLTPAEPVRRPRWGRALSIAVVGSLVALTVVVGPQGSVQAVRDAVSGSTAGMVAGRDRPTPRASSGERLAPPVTPPGVSDAYAFLATGFGGDPVTYDPCQPIPYVVRPDGAPPGGDAVIAEAVRRTEAATGLRFIAEGTTEEAPSDDREPFQPDRYGNRWAPVLIAWSDPSEVPGLAGRVAGLGGSTPVLTPTGAQVLVTGEVTLDAATMRELFSSREGVEAARAVIQHELGHLVGLDHVEDPTQLMHGDGHPGIVDFAAGDLAGLARLGAGPCVHSV